MSITSRSWRCRALALGEYLAGAILGLMLTGGAALERFAVARARRELSALVQRAPRIAHRRAGSDIIDVDIANVVIWSTFDARLRAHLELEERYLIPPFAQNHPDDAARLLAEHALIRTALLELGVAFDQHVSCADRIAWFAKLLRLHAMREDKLLYAWAEENIEAGIGSKVLERL